MRIVALTFAAALLFCARAAEACSCVVSQHTTCAGTLEADAVLLGTVVRIDREPTPPDPPAMNPPNVAMR